MWTNGYCWDKCRSHIITKMGFDLIKIFLYHVLFSLFAVRSAPVFSPIISPRNISVPCVCLYGLSACLCDTQAISLHDNCQCVHSGWFIGPESGGLSRKEGSPSSWKGADAGLKLTAFQYANFLCLFICFLMTSSSSQRGIFFLLWKKETTQSFFLLIICHWHIKVKDWNNFDWKVCSTLEMDAFESLPFNTNKCFCHYCPLWHTFPLPLPTHLLLFFPPSIPALIRVMPTQHSTIR